MASVVSRPTDVALRGLWIAVGIAWLAMLLLPLLGREWGHAHHGLDGSGRLLPLLGQVLVVLLAWQVMTVAMMLPSSLPVIRPFLRASRNQERHALVVAAFLGAYLAVWTGFAAVALAGDAALQGLVGGWSWLEARPQLVSGGVLILAGGFQFSPLKERCLRACRSPVGFLWRHYQRGTGAAWALGLRHGLFCLGCCWALMLLMVAVGLDNLLWMVGLTAVMLFEKTARHGRRAVPLVGAALLLWGALVLAQPGWLPETLGGSPSADQPAAADDHSHH